MTDESYRNNMAWRLAQAEKKIDMLEAGQPAVMAERIGMLSNRVSELRMEVMDDMRALRDDMRQRDDAREKQIKSFQRIFITVFSGVGVAVAVAVIAQLLAGGTP